MGPDPTQESRELVQFRVAGNPAEHKSQSNVCVVHLGRRDSHTFHQFSQQRQNVSGKAKSTQTPNGSEKAAETTVPAWMVTRHQHGKMVTWKPKVHLSIFT